MRGQKDSPQQASHGRARAFFIFILCFFAAYVVLAGAGFAMPGQIVLWMGLSQGLAVLSLPVLLVLRFARGREAFAQAGLRPGSPRVWLLAGIAVALFCATQTLLNAALGLGRAVQPAEYAASLGLPVEVFLPVAFVQSVVLGPLLGLVITFGEEYGWRGFLQGELVKLGRIRGVLLVGVIWGLWHAPIIMMGHNYPGYPVFGPILMVGYTVVFGFVLGYAVLKTGSIWLAALLHAVSNQTTSFLFALVYTPADNVFSFGAGIYTVAIGAVIVALILRDQVWRDAPMARVEWTPPSQPAA